MALAPGYSLKAIRANILAMLDRGVPRETAIRAAHAQARAAFFRRHASGTLPDYIYPDLNVRGNPVGDLNPHDVAKGLKLYERFSGRPAGKRRLIRRPELPDALVCIGDISVIQYVAERDGETFEFRHPFRAGSRPLLCVTPDGKLVLALGGAWTFTEDGFVDK